MDNDNSTSKLVVISVLGGLLLLIGAVFLFSTKEKVTLPLKVQEFTDFECPACASYHPVVNDLMKQFTDNVSFEFINYPLTSIHPDAYQAALAGEAARIQGKFAEYADLLFTNQDKLKRDNLIAFATQLGMDPVKFTADMDSATVKAKVDSDIKEGEDLGINATPTFYINGEKVVFQQGDDPAQVLKDLISQKITLGLSQAQTK
jgi:protein-disulfide isomerase